MKEIAEWFVIALTSLISLIILGMVFIEFGAIDTTLVAGIIAFVGAIIGGFLTLLGVRKTIKNGNEIESYKIFVEQYQASLKATRMFIDATNVLIKNYNECEESYNELLEKLIEKFNEFEGILDSATLSTDFFYNSIVEYYDFLTGQQDEVNDDGFLSGLEGYKEFEPKTDKCITILKEELKRLREEILNNNPSKI